MTLVRGCDSQCCGEGVEGTSRPLKGVWSEEGPHRRGESVKGKSHTEPS